MAHHRLFVALHPPAAVRSALLALKGGIAGARWQDDGQLHCTVRFLGELDRHAAEDVAQALLALAHPAIEATLDGYGSFDDRGRVSSLWVGLAPGERLRAFHARIDRLLLAAGLPPDPRAYRPHITVARFARSTAPPVDAVARLPPPPRLAVRFDEVRLYESLLGREGARYEPVARYRLDD